MLKKKLLAGILSAALTISTFTLPSIAPQVDAEAGFYKGSAIDLGIANDERVIEMLKKEGRIPQNATMAEAEQALQSYLKAKAEGALKEPVGDLVKEEKEQLRILDDKLNETGLVNGLGKKVGQNKSTLANVVEEGWNGSVRKDKILVLLIDYADYKHNNIQSGETDMYYPTYPKEHYEAMIFGENGYTGPNGEDLVSMKQFYEEQSGGSYSIEGQIAGWYTAKNDAAYYGGNNASDNDSKPRNLVYEALLAAAADPNVNLADFDQEDRYDLDGDGNYREPDGLVDHLMVIHAGVGEEAGGGSLGSDAIWSHRWNLGGVATIPNTQAAVPYWGDKMGAYDYTIEPEDGAAGVFAHEYGHDLGLPDEYDTIYSGPGEAVAYWSIMASGSWAGAVPGTEPTGFSAWAKQFLQSSMDGSNWLKGSTVHADNVTSKGVEFVLDQANSKGTNNDAVRIDLPDKVNFLNTPAAGQFEFYGGKGDEIDHTLTTTVDLTNAANATLEFDTWYEIEGNWDFGMVQVSTDNGVTWQSLATARTSSSIVDDGYPAIKENMPGYTGTSNGWVHESIDLTPYVGQMVGLQFRYMTDWGTTLRGFFVDNVRVVVDGAEVFNDGAEGDSSFVSHGFEKHEGKVTTTHYYLLEWRNHQGVDQGLAHIRRGSSLMSYDPGLVIWYVDDSYDDNWTGVHPGDGYLGVVDADQVLNRWLGINAGLGSTRYQLHDAAFSLKSTEKMFLDYTEYYGYSLTMQDNATVMNPVFDDSASYTNLVMPYAGRNIPNYGLKIRVITESPDRSVAKIKVYK